MVLQVHGSWPQFDAGSRSSGTVTLKFRTTFVLTTQRWGKDISDPREDLLVR